MVKAVIFDLAAASRLGLAVKKYTGIKDLTTS